MNGNSIKLKSNIKMLSRALICLIIVVINTIFLFNRQLELNIILTIALSIVLIFFVSWTKTIVFFPFSTLLCANRSF